MHLFRIFKISVLATALVMVAPFSLTAAASTSGGQVVMDPVAMQKVVTQLQSQMEKIANSVSKQFATQNDANQKAINDLHKQTQVQLAHLQMEIQQLQDLMVKDISQVQKEVQ